MEGLRLGIAVPDVTSARSAFAVGTGSYTVQCKAGGTVTFGSLPAFIGGRSTVGITGVTEEFRDCAWDDDVRYLGNGSVNLTGNFDQFSRSQNFRVRGNLDTNPGGVNTIALTVTGEGSFTGTVGGQSIEGTGITRPFNLTGLWTGRAGFANLGPGCSGAMDLTIRLASTNPASGTVFGEVNRMTGGSDPVCSRFFPDGIIGATGNCNLSGTLAGGRVDVNCTGGNMTFTAIGEYSGSGQSMFGTYDRWSTAFRG